MDNLSEEGKERCSSAVLNAVLNKPYINFRFLTSTGANGHQPFVFMCQTKQGTRDKYRQRRE